MDSQGCTVGLGPKGISRQGKSVSNEAGSRSLHRRLDLGGSRDHRCLEDEDSQAFEVTQSVLE